MGSGLFGAAVTTYLNCVLDTTSDTTKIPLYPDVLIPEIRTGVSIERSVSVESKSTVTVDLDQTLTDLSIDTPVRISGISTCLLYTSPSPRDGLLSRMPSSA